METLSKNIEVALPPIARLVDADLVVRGPKEGASDFDRELNRKVDEPRRERPKEAARDNADDRRVQEPERVDHKEPIATKADADEPVVNRDASTVEEKTTEVAAGETDNEAIEQIEGAPKQAAAVAKTDQPAITPDASGIITVAKPEQDGEVPVLDPKMIVAKAETPESVDPADVPVEITPLPVEGRPLTLDERRGGQLARLMNEPTQDQAVRFPREGLAALVRGEGNSAAGGMDGDAGGFVSAIGKRASSEPGPDMANLLKPAQQAPAAAVNGQAASADALAKSFNGGGNSIAALESAKQIGETGRAAQMQAAHRPQTPEQQPVQNQIAVQMSKAAKDGIERIRIQLHPAELGRVEVKMEVAHDGRLTAVISADRPEALDMLRRDVNALEKALADAGLKTDSGSLNFTLNREQTAGEADDKQPAGRSADEDGDFDDEALEDMAGELAAQDGRWVSLDGQVDIRI